MKMKMKKSKKNLKGEEAFDAFYSSFYEDYDELKAALLEEYPKVDYRPFDGDESYFIDEASIMAAQALQVNENDHVLDMCAAPGGKSLILLERSPNVSLNEKSANRIARLRKVISTYVPKERAPLEITKFDATQIGVHRPGHFDKVLLDAPCSSESHVLKSGSKELDLWSPGRTKRLASLQYSLLCSAYLALKPEGEMIYSTCSISPYENEKVIAKFLKKKEIKEIKIDGLEYDKKCDFGGLILPHLSQRGPLYFIKMKKKSL